MKNSTRTNPLPSVIAGVAAAAAASAFLVAQPAYAGYWSLTGIPTGGATAEAGNSYSPLSVTYTTSSMSVSNTSVVSNAAPVTGQYSYTGTITWVPNNGDLQTDPAPATVTISESADVAGNALYTGNNTPSTSANDGLGDASVTTNFTGYPGNAQYTTSSGTHTTTVSVPTGGSYQFTRSFSSYAFGGSVDEGILGYYDVSVPGPTAPVIAISAGGSAASPFVADTDFSGGSVSSGTTHAITTTGLTDPAPQEVYQHGRDGNFTYTVGGLTPGAPYTVRLHFAEYYFDASGSREFNVSINGTQVLTDFDIFATAGGQYIAVIEPFSATATSSGQIAVQFTSVVNNSIVGGIEVDYGSGSTFTLAPENASSLFLSAAGTSNGSAVSVGSTLSLWADASAAPYLNYLELSSGSYCLQSAGTTSGSGEEIWACDGAAAQTWDIVADTSPVGYYQLQQGVSGGTLCLDATGTTSGSAVEAVTCNSSAAQQWTPSGL
jgi:beta-galactosidase